MSESTLQIIYAILLLGGMGLAFGVILALASKVFAVEADPRQDAIAEVLPGANCGGCGFAGCSAYAAAVAAGKAPVIMCPVGGPAVAAQVAAIMGVEAAATVRMAANVNCTGGGKDHQKYLYVGVNDCLAATRLPGGSSMECAYGCMGLGTCVKRCQFDAIHIVDGVAKVDKEKCTGCGACIEDCPRHVISLVPADLPVNIPCNSKDAGKVVTKVCSNGCIACNLCVKNCPVQAITMENFLARVDYTKCTGCGTCVSKCPRKLIVMVGGTPEIDCAPAAE